MKKMKKWLMILICMASLGFVGCTNQEQEGTAQQPAPTTTPVADATAKKTSDVLVYTGAIKPIDDIQVLPKIAGTIQSVAVQIGSKVKAGDVLCEFDGTDIALQLQQAKASVTLAQTNLDRVKNGSSVQTIEQLTQALDKANIDLKDASTNYDRVKAAFDARIQTTQTELALTDATTAYNNQKQLLDEGTTLATVQNNYNDAKLAYDNAMQLYAAGAVTLQSTNDAESKLKNAEAALTSAQTATTQALDSARIKMETAEKAYKNAVVNERADLNSAETKLATAKLAVKTAGENLALNKNVLNPENIKTAEAQLASAQAAYDITNRQFTNTKVTAPIDGEIAALPVQQGMLVTTSTPLAGIVNLASVNIEIQVSQSDISHMQEGKEVLISVQSTEIKDLKGKITAVSPSANLQTGMFVVKITVDNADRTLKGGMFADVKITR